jgi:hypothetical protein
MEPLAADDLERWRLPRTWSVRTPSPSRTGNGRITSTVVDYLIRLRSRLADWIPVPCNTALIGPPRQSIRALRGAQAGKLDQVR